MLASSSTTGRTTRAAGACVIAAFTSCSAGMIGTALASSRLVCCGTTSHAFSLHFRCTRVSKSFHFMPLALSFMKLSDLPACRFNPTGDGCFSGGDVIQTFMAILIGAFALGQAGEWPPSLLSLSLMM